MSQSSSLQPFLDRLLAHSILNDEEQSAVLSLPTLLVNVRARQDFVRLNEETTHSCLIVSGVAGRFGQTSDGRRQTTAFHIPGDMADLHSAVRPIGIGGLTALCDTTILRIPHSAIRSVAASSPAIAEAFWRDCLLDAAVLMQWAVNVGRRDAQGRLAHIICEMAIRFGEDRDVLLNYIFPVTQEHLGEATGLTSVHVNRSLVALRDKGLVLLKNRCVEIRNWTGLARLADFDATYLVADAPPNPLLTPVRTLPS